MIRIARLAPFVLGFALSCMLACSSNPTRSTSTKSFPKLELTLQLRRDLKTIFFTDTLHGWVCGAMDSVFRTTNGGEVWQPFALEIPKFSTACQDIQFRNNDYGWAVGGFETIWHSHDGGVSWTIQTSKYGTGGVLEAVHMVDLLNGWAVNGNHNILRTTDGGANWNGFDTGLGFASQTDCWFINDTTGWLIASGTALEPYIMRTVNGGTSWIHQNLEDSSARAWLSAIQFVNDTVGWIVGDGIILNTTNGGMTWQNQKQVSHILRAVSFINDRIGCAVGDSYSLLYTSDGGVHWYDYSDSLPKLLGDSIQYTFFMGVSWVSDKVGWIVGNNGVIKVRIK